MRNYYLVFFKVVWKKNGVLVSVYTAPGVLLVPPQQQLYIPKIRPHDSGIYECTAINKVGVLKKDFSVNVHGKH